MKKVTLLALAVLASLLMSFAKTDKDDILNNKYIAETEREAMVDTESDYLYININEELDLINEVDLENIKDNINTIIFDDICNDFENYYIRTTVAECTADINNKLIYDSIYEDMETESYLTLYIK